MAERDDERLVAEYPGSSGDDIVALPERPGLPPPCPRPPDPGPVDEELRIALERARLVADELESVLRPAAQALRDGAWVSRRADEFSLELDENARLCGTIAGRGVEAIEELARRGRPGGDDVEVLPAYPQFGPISAYDDGYGG